MRKLKVIGLSVIAVLAVSAVGASAASAAEGTAVVSAGSTSYTAHQTGAGHTFTLVGGRVLSCANATFSGTVANGAKTVTATPSYSNCSVKVGASTLPATVNTTDCTYTFRDLTTGANTDTWTALTDLECPVGANGVHISVYQNATNHANNVRLCEYTVTPVTGLTGVDFIENTAGGDIEINATNVAVPTERTFGNAVNCGEANFNSTYAGNTTLTPATGTVAIDH